MAASEIKHFLIVYDIPNGVAHVEAFGTEYKAALEAYASAEQRYREDEDIEVVLLGSDARETLERTHSSYFELSDRHVDRMVAKELAELGLN